MSQGQWTLELLRELTDQIEPVDGPHALIVIAYGSDLRLTVKLGESKRLIVLDDEDLEMAPSYLAAVVKYLVVQRPDDERFLKPKQGMLDVTSHTETHVGFREEECTKCGLPLANCPCAGGPYRFNAPGPCADVAGDRVCILEAGHEVSHTDGKVKWPTAVPEP